MASVLVIAVGCPWARERHLGRRDAEVLWVAELLDNFVDAFIEFRQSVGVNTEPASAVVDAVDRLW